MELLPISSLYLDLPSVVNRAHFTAKARREPPIYDPNKPVKRWVDPSKLNIKPDQQVSYLVIVDGKLRDLTMTAFDAVNVNLPEAIEDGALEVPWPCRPLAGDERIKLVGSLVMVEKGTE